MFTKDHLSIIGAVAMTLFRVRGYGSEDEKWQRMRKRTVGLNSNGIIFTQEATEDEYCLYIVDINGKEFLGVERRECIKGDYNTEPETLGYVALGPRDCDAINLGDYCKVIEDLIESKRF